MGLETAIALALAAAGTGVSVAGQRRQQRDMNDALRASLAEQDEYQRKTTPIVEQNIEASGSGPAMSDISMGAQNAAELYRRLQALPVSGEPSPVTDQIVQTGLNERVNRANLAQAGLQGYNEQAFQQWLRNQNVGNQLNVLTNFSRGSAATTPYRIQNAQQRGQDLAAIGSLLSTAGTLGGIYSAVQTPTTGNPNGN